MGSTFTDVMPDGPVSDTLPWKDRLIKAAARLELKTKQTRRTARTSYLIERDFVIAAYAMRKVSESQTVSNETRRRQIPVKRFG